MQADSKDFEKCLQNFLLLFNLFDGVRHLDRFWENAISNGKHAFALMSYWLLLSVQFAKGVQRQLSQQ